MLFDDGKNSGNQSPAGDDRTYSAPRKYAIDFTRKIATEVWHYTPTTPIFSPYCSSIYEDAAGHYLIDYAIENFTTTEIIGLDPHGTRIFDYQYPALNFCGTAWNAKPIHLESLVFQ